MFKSKIIGKIEENKPEICSKLEGLSRLAHLLDKYWMIYLTISKYSTLYVNNYLIVKFINSNSRHII